MKKLFLILNLFVFFAGFVHAQEQQNFKVAIIDIQKLTQNSPKIKIIKNEQQKKLEDLVKFAQYAKSDIEKQSDVTNKKTLEDKYNKQFLEKKEIINKEYLNKLNTVDKEISAQIDNFAKENSYDLIVTKDTVLSGGKDITDEIIKILK